jgi:energy-coupling factor transport system ATP-binding protein
MAACGNIKPYSGKINVFGKKISSYKDDSLYKNCLTVLPQDPQTLFLKNTVKEELDDMGIIPENLPFDLSALYGKHPYDLSGGEQQLLALAKVLARDPRLILMDEPTKGLDSQKKLEAVKILKKLKENGVTVVCVTHDVEFAALCADRCAMFFKGQTVYTGTADGLFCGNKFYTTAASRMTKGYFENAITADDVIELCRKNGRKNVGGMQ